MVARRAHNPKVVGSNPASATRKKPLTIPMVEGFVYLSEFAFSLFQYRFFIKLYRKCTGMKSDIINL